MRKTYDKRRKILVAGLRKLGFGVHFEPKGAFYVLADARHIDNNSQRLALDILEKTGVAITPGVDFGSGAEGFLRFSYTRPSAEIVSALERIGDYLQQQGK
jgi:aspartate aminotransferase